MEAHVVTSARNRYRLTPPFTHQMPGKSNWGTLSGMVDIDLIVQTLRQHGHRVEHVISVPDNAGEYELIVDGITLNLEEARQMLEEDQAKK